MKPSYACSYVMTVTTSTNEANSSMPKRPIYAKKILSILNCWRFFLNKKIKTTLTCRSLFDLNYTAKCFKHCGRALRQYSAELLWNAKTVLCTLSLIYGVVPYWYAGYVETFFSSREMFLFIICGAFVFIYGTFLCFICKYYKIIKIYLFPIQSALRIYYVNKNICYLSQVSMVWMWQVKKY